MKTKKTAQKILEHATEEFAKIGFAGTIMDELADISQVNKSSIYYYYNSKEKLYEHVLLNLVSALLEELKENCLCDSSSEDKLRSFIRTFASFSSKNRAFPSIMMREIASGGENMPTPVKKVMVDILTIIKEILSEGKENASFKDVDPMVTHMMIIGSIQFYIASEPLRNRQDQATKELHNVITKNSIDEATQHITNMLCSAILKENK